MKLDKHGDDHGTECWSAWDDVHQVGLDPEQLKMAREEELRYIVDMNVFKLMDIDGSGFIEAEELFAAMRRLSPVC